MVTSCGCRRSGAGPGDSCREGARDRRFPAVLPRSSVTAPPEEDEPPTPASSRPDEVHRGDRTDAGGDGDRTEGLGSDMDAQRAPAGSARSRARLGFRLLRARRITSWTEVRRMLVGLVVAWVVLSFTIWVMPGLSAAAHVDVLLAAAVLGILTALLRPAVTSLALLLGWVGVLVAGVFAQALFFTAALALTPGITVASFWDAFWGSWIFSLLTTLAGWLGSAGDDTAFLSHLLGRSRDT